MTCFKTRRQFGEPSEEMAENPSPPPPTLSDKPDIITNILGRLPVKSLLRFRSVSKPWCSQIASPDFIKQHLQHSLETNTNHTLLLRHKERHFTSIDCDTLNEAVTLHHPLESENYRREVVGSCNGLLAYLYQCEDDVVLWNPSTGKHFFPPSAPLRFPGDGFHWCEFVAFGLGYDSVSDDYKIVRNAQFYQNAREDDFDSRVQVFSLKTGYWRRTRDCPYYLKNKRVEGVLASESVHWLASKKPKSDTKDLIVAFDLRTEEFSEVDQPDYSEKGKERYKHLAALGGCLCLLVHYIDAEIDGRWDGSTASHVDVWVMKEYGIRQSWIKLFTLGNPQNIGHLEFVLPLMYSKYVRKVLLCLDGKKLVWFDLINKSIEDEIKIPGLPSRFGVYMCARSLVSPFPCLPDLTQMAMGNLFLMAAAVTTVFRIN